MRRNTRRLLVILAVAAVVVAAVALMSRSAENFRRKYEGQDLSTDIGGISRSDTYSKYVADHAGLDYAGEAITAGDITSFTGGGEAVSEDGVDCVLIREGDVTTWKFNVPPQTNIVERKSSILPTSYYSA